MAEVPSNVRTLVSKTLCRNRFSFFESKHPMEPFYSSRTIMVKRSATPAGYSTSVITPKFAGCQAGERPPPQFIWAAGPMAVVVVQLDGEAELRRRTPARYPVRSKGCAARRRSGRRRP